MAQIALEKIMQRRTEIEEKVGAAQMREIERIILLRIVDSKWMEHIDNMDQLKQGINLRAYGQTDPVQAYTKEGFEMFEEMNATIIDETVRYLFNFKLQQQPKIQEKQLGVISTNQGASKEKIKREGHISKNAPCPCGSGKKYKRCCGKKNNDSPLSFFSGINQQLRHNNTNINNQRWLKTMIYLDEIKSELADINRQIIEMGDSL
jgi:preprotein translocase subunit SecA